MKAWLGGRWAAIWRVIGGVSLRVKIVGVGLAMIIILGLGLNWQVRATTRRILSDDLELRGISAANALPRESGHLLADGNLTALAALVQNTVTDNAGVEYAFVLDDQGHPIADSFGGALPSGLATANAAQPTERYRARTVRVAGGLSLDIAVPVAGGGGGTVRERARRKGRRFARSRCRRALAG